jgi:cytoskeletal protein CcmA (bactofilin family)
MGFRKSKPNPDDADTVVGRNTVLEGKIWGQGGMRIDGTVKGEVDCRGTVIVGIGGRVEANITAQGAIIGGEVLGNIAVEGRLELVGKGKVRGDITASQLVVEEGVTLEGSCHMLTQKITEPLNSK